MPRYKTTLPAYVGDRYLGADVEFSSDAVPGRTWRPVCKEAKAAVRERDAAAKAARDAADKPASSEREDALEAELADAKARINELQAEVEALTAPPPAADKK